jgi:hypothetical protein
MKSSRRAGVMASIFVLVLSLSGCASTCEFENTLVFMEKNAFEEVCMVMNEPPELAGHEYCLRKKAPVSSETAALPRR